MESDSAMQVSPKIVDFQHLAASPITMQTLMNIGIGVISSYTCTLSAVGYYRKRQSNRMITVQRVQAINMCSPTC